MATQYSPINTLYLTDTHTPEHIVICRYINTTFTENLNHTMLLFSDALAKMDETLQSEYWSEPVAAGASAAVGALLWVPRSADWFITLLKTIEERYAMLPQPGHR